MSNPASETKTALDQTQNGQNGNGNGGQKTAKDEVHFNLSQELKVLKENNDKQILKFTREIRKKQESDTFEKAPEYTDQVAEYTKKCTAYIQEVDSMCEKLEICLGEITASQKGFGLSQSMLNTLVSIATKYEKHARQTKQEPLQATEAEMLENDGMVFCTKICALVFKFLKIMNYEKESAELRSKFPVVQFMYYFKNTNPELLSRMAKVWEQHPELNVELLGGSQTAQTTPSQAQAFTPLAAAQNASGCGIKRGLSKDNLCKNTR